MKRKIINTVITNKFNRWVKTLPEVGNLREMVQKNTILTGGSITSMLLGEPANDFDFYFRNKETAYAVAQYYVAQFKAIKSAKRPDHKVDASVTCDNFPGRIKIVVASKGVASTDDGFEGFDLTDPESQAWMDAIVGAVEKSKEKEPETYEARFLSANAITLSDQVQLVTRFYGDPDRIHENYDFVHCTNYWCSWNRELVLKPEALEATLTKELRYVGSRYPVASIFRLRKFINRGWRITAGQMFKICWQISELDLKDRDVLEDQLTGVDTSYFMAIIAILQKHNGERIDGNYLMKLMDKMF